MPSEANLLRNGAGSGTAAVGSGFSSSARVTSRMSEYVVVSRPLGSVIRVAKIVDPSTTAEV